YCKSWGFDTFWCDVRRNPGEPCSSAPQPHGSWSLTCWEHLFRYHWYIAWLHAWTPHSRLAHRYDGHRAPQPHDPVALLQRDEFCQKGLRRFRFVLVMDEVERVRPHEGGQRLRGRSMNHQVCIGERDGSLARKPAREGVHDAGLGGECSSPNRCWCGDVFELLEQVHHIVKPARLCRGVYAPGGWKEDMERAVGLQHPRNFTQHGVHGSHDVQRHVREHDITRGVRQRHLPGIGFHELRRGGGNLLSCRREGRGGEIHADVAHIPL